MTRLVRQSPAPKPGIVHLGPGAFFRAFNAVYTADAMARSGGDWGIIAVSLRSPTARDQLTPQGGAYTAVELGPEGRKPSVIEAITDVLVAPENPTAVVSAMADPAIKIVSLTITEKGYCLDPATGALNLDHPDIAQDIANLDAPQSAPGFLVAALAQRHRSGAKPFTVLSCDNLPSNGILARAAIIDFARAVDPGLADWIAQNVPFPSTMVDRITPATTSEDLAQLQNETGLDDRGAVFHEPFKQWVIEDDFADGHPDWASAGAQFVQSVQAHETMKLRCLNGTHSTLAYLGYLAGHETIADCVADAPFAHLCERLWADEILPSVPQPEGEDLPAYAAALLKRYQNPAIRHRTWQIAMDGSQKLPQRLLATIADNLEAERPIDGLCLAVAAWMRYVGAVDEAGAVIDVRDPLAAELKTLSDCGTTAADKVTALLSERRIFPKPLASNDMFKRAVTSAFTDLSDRGAAQSVLRYLEGSN